ncbi:hypothetical protein UlMin_036859 [Ulmus minor]
MQTHWVVDCVKEEDEDKGDDLWMKMMEEARSDIEEELILLNYYFNLILAHNSIESTLANHLSIKLSDSKDEEIVRAVKDDLQAAKERDPACISYIHYFLNFKRFLACQAHRVAHKLWSQGRKVLALLIQNIVSEVFSTLGGTGKISRDRHPKIGDGVLIGGRTCILGNIKIGEEAKIGARSVVLKEVPPQSMATGNPSRLVRGK